MTLTVPIPTKERKRTYYEKLALERRIAAFNQLVFGLAIIVLLCAVSYQTYQMYSINSKIRDLDSNIHIVVGKVLDGNSSYDYDNVAGRYLDSAQLIRVYARYRSPEDVLNTSIHEVGHYVQSRFIGIDDPEYLSIFNSTNHFVSNYSRTNDREYFAETFANSMQSCIDMDRVPEDQKDYFIKHVLPHFKECKELI
jgi:hypothetical protein